MKGLSPDRVEVYKGGWTRGYHGVSWTYTVHESCDKLRKQIAGGYQLLPGSIVYVRRLPDRVQQITPLEGRYVEQRPRNWVYLDRGTYTTLKITESPYTYGPLPKHWYRGAKADKPIVKVPDPQLPSLGMLKPLIISTGLTEVGNLQAWVQWSVPYSADEMRKRIDADIAGGAPWRKQGSRYVSSKHDGTWVWLDTRYVQVLPSGSKEQRWVLEASFTASREHALPQPRKTPRVHRGASK